MWVYTNSDELMHWGIKGMKWGVRRYQDKSGRRTTLGKKRYSRKDSMSADAREAAIIKKKKVSQMSNEELRKLNNRQQLERTYHQMNKGTVAKGLAAVAASAAAMNTILNLYNNSDKIISAGKKISDKIVNAAGDKMMRELNSGLQKGW